MIGNRAVQRRNTAMQWRIVQMLKEHLSGH